MTLTKRNGDWNDGYRSRQLCAWMGTAFVEVGEVGSCRLGKKFTKEKCRGKGRPKGSRLGRKNQKEKRKTGGKGKKGGKEFF